MDEKFIEQAAEHEENLRAGAQAIVSAKAIPTKDLEPHEYKWTECQKCGDDLPEFRMKKGRDKCTACQALIEQIASKMYGK